MKTFEVELRRTSYITITVEAENEDDAEDKAWAQVEACLLYTSPSPRDS